MSKSEKTIVITGASSGIGLGLAEAFLREGYNVVGTGRSAQRLKATADQLKPMQSVACSLLLEKFDRFFGTLFPFGDST
jgi:short-subunit dehydrogenase